MGLFNFTYFIYFNFQIILAMLDLQFQVHFQEPCAVSAIVSKLQNFDATVY